MVGPGLVFPTSWPPDPHHVHPNTGLRVRLVGTVHHGEAWSDASALLGA